ncbi:MAG TPA: hypothetical protein VGH80_10925 [Xanthomonadaceae bacterium]
MTALIPASSTGGAKAALDGYEYQLSVSVLVALRLMLIAKSASRITLEPASEEDLEMDLEPETPGRVQPSANVANGYKLVVQVKLRNSGPWSIADFKTLLEHGTKRRPAKHHLDDPGTRYLLITSADATGEVRDLLVQGLEEWPPEQDFPVSLSATLPHAPEGRIGIWGVLTERLLDLEINDILGPFLRVPQSRRTECRTWLRKEAQQRMRGTSPGVWTREDLLSVIRGCGGYLASAHQLEAFVPPANYQAMVALLEERNAIVITGPSGTGKTWTALALADHARQRNCALEIVVVNINDGPSSTRTPVDTGPKLFYMEDPWGQFSLRGGADAWTEQLPRLLREAHAGHQYIITSRTDMLVQANAGDNLKRWTKVLDADHYRDGELARIYEKRLELLATDLQAKALDFRAGALEALETPLELELFFSHLADGPVSGEVDATFFRRILALSHRNAVENVVVSYLNASGEAGCTAIVWALLSARSQFDRSQLMGLGRQFRTIGTTIAEGLEKLVNRLVATRHLRQPGQSISFSHSSVRAGFEMYIKENWWRSEAALVSLIRALTQVSGQQRDWALETAARAVKTIKDLLADTEDPSTTFEPDSASCSAIDTWLEEGLVDPHADFLALLQLASEVGTSTSSPSELARWFIQGFRRGGQFFLVDWRPPDFDDAWYDRVRADPRSFVIADRFIREQLPRERDGYGDRLAEKLDRIAVGLTPAFLVAARKLVSSGFNSNICAVAVGAVRDLVRYEEVLELALDELQDVRRSYEQEGRQRWRAIEDGECNASVEDAYESQHEDDGYAAGIFVSTYVRQVRSTGQWSSLMRHPRISELGRAWAEELTRADSVPLKELQLVIYVTQSSGGEDYAWEAAREHWRSSLSLALEQRIVSNPSDDTLRGALAYCALTKAPAVIATCIDRLAGTPAPFVHLLVDLNAAHSRILGKTRARRMRSLVGILPCVAGEIFAALSDKSKPPATVGPQALSVLERAAETATPAVLDAIVPIMIASGVAPSAAIRRWLVESTDHRLAKAAAEAAVCIQDDALVWLALEHVRADARETALTYLAGRMPDPLPACLLGLSSDPGSRVRRALVRLIAMRPCPEHQCVLVKLVADAWSDTGPYHYEDRSYLIAREAVDALAKYGRLSDDIGEALLCHAERTDDRSLSVVALNTAARCCDFAIRAKIWALSLVGQPRWVCIDAIGALIQANVVESEITDKITADLILRLPPPLAASVCVLLAIHGRVESVIAAMERIAHSAERRALVLLGARGLALHDRQAALGLLAMLRPDHPAQQLLDLHDGEKLAKTVLDDLGNVRIRKAVRTWLDDMIAKD